MIQNNRIFFSDAGVLTDLSKNLNRFQSGTDVVPLEANVDFIYIGSDFPFNHRHVDVSVVNDQAADVAKVELYNGSTWVDAVNIIDYTNTGTIALAQDGIISWNPDKNESWVRDDTENITELNTLRIDGFYWARISYDANLNALTALNFVGHKFSDDEQLGTLYPELETQVARDSFENGKTSWDEQHIKAAEVIIRDLTKYRSRIHSRNQILDYDRLTLPAIHQVAVIVYRALGDDWVNDYNRALQEYSEARGNMVEFRFDEDNDARQDRSEKTTESIMIRR